MSLMRNSALYQYAPSNRGGPSPKFLKWEILKGNFKISR